MDLSRKRFAFVAGAIVIVLTSCAYPVGQPELGNESRSYAAYIKGLVTDRLGSFEEAASHYKAAQKLDSRSALPHVQLGLDYVGLKEFRKAAEEFQAALKLAPEDESARHVLALVYVQLEDYRNAAEQYEILLKGATSLQRQIQLRRILSQLYFLYGDYGGSKKHSAKVLDFDPMDREALYFMGLLSSEEGRSDEALGYFNKLLEHYPQDTDAMNSLAFMYAESGANLVKALDLATYCVSQDPYNAAYLDTLGWVYFKLGQFEKSVEYLRQAAKVEMDPLILKHLSEAYKKSEEKKEQAGAVVR